MPPDVVESGDIMRRLAADKITGKLVMSFSDSKLDILNGYTMIFINCAGTQSFEAIPAA